MASRTSALLVLAFSAVTAPDDPYEGPGNNLKIENDTNGRRWSQGNGSGQVDSVLRRDGTLAGGGSDSYDLLAAGGLVDAQNQPIDADEAKVLIIKCVTGSITVKNPAANGLDCFTAASEGIALTAGQSFAFDLGALGLDVATNSKFDIAEVGAVGATYILGLAVAQ